MSIDETKLDFWYKKLNIRILFVVVVQLFELVLQYNNVLRSHTSMPPPLVIRYFRRLHFNDIYNN